MYVVVTSNTSRSNCQSSEDSGARIHESPHPHPKSLVDSLLLCTRGEWVCSIDVECSVDRLPCTVQTINSQLACIQVTHTEQ